LINEEKGNKEKENEIYNHVIGEQGNWKLESRIFEISVWITP
jgi:hypothetical protein